MSEVTWAEFALITVGCVLLSIGMVLLGYILDELRHRSDPDPLEEYRKGLREGYTLAHCGRHDIPVALGNLMDQETMKLVDIQTEEDGEQVQGGYQL